MDPKTKNRSPLRDSSNSVIFMLWLVVSLSHAQACRWDALEAVANRIPDDDFGMTQKEAYAHHLWHLYKSSNRSERPKVVYKISESFKQIAYRDTRLDMIGLILFGPEKARSILGIENDQDVYEKENVSQCLKNMDNLFKKHCGPLTPYGMRHHYSFINICYYVKEMAMIEDAIIATCGLNNVAPSVVDLDNPSIDIRPAPIHGSDIYCGRVFVNGISRMKLHSYTKVYQTVFKPVPHKLRNKVQICFHRNASRGLCQCEKDEWRPIQKLSRIALMSPYEKRFVDVKFTSAAYGYVTMTLDEVPLVPLQLLCYAMLAGGVSLLFMSTSMWVPCCYTKPMVIGASAVFLILIFFRGVSNQNAAKNDAIGKWVMRVVGVIAIFQSSFDTLLAMVALASSLALIYAISFIRAQILKNKELLAWKELRESLIKDEYVEDYVAEWASVRDFRDWVIKNPHRIMFLRNYSQDSE